jgi:nucleoside-diphosphate-sugar epimerase
MELVIVRPPLVYGPEVSANFLRLLQLVDRGVWLPLGMVANRRSLIYVGNLASAIAVCLRHSGAAGRTFLVSDGEDVSTPELIRRLAAAMGKTARCAPLPPVILWSIAAALRRKDQALRVLGSLQIDSGLIRRELSWEPPFSLDDGLTTTAAWFRDRSRSETSCGAIA